MTVVTHNLEKETEAFIESLQAKNPPPIYTLSPQQARSSLDNLQAHFLDTALVQIEEKTITSPKGLLSLYFIHPKRVKGRLPAILFIHGAGWVMGNFTTHGRLARELAAQSQSIVVFINYSLSPEARFPTALEEIYSALKYVHDNARELGIDSTRISVAGDSVGGNMTAALTLLAKEQGGPHIHSQLLFYPVTSSELSTNSYQQFADGPWLTKPAMEWFWNAYEPDLSKRNQILVSPLNATIDQLKNLPPALIITAENDVLRDEGEDYAHKLMRAGVEVTAMRFLGTIHDFMMLNALARTPASQEALNLAVQFMNQT